MVFFRLDLYRGDEDLCTVFTRQKYVIVWPVRGRARGESGKGRRGGAEETRFKAQQEENRPFSANNIAGRACWEIEGGYDDDDSDDGHHQALAIEEPEKKSKQGRRYHSLSGKEGKVFVKAVSGTWDYEGNLCLVSKE